MHNNINIMYNNHNNKRIDPVNFEQHVEIPMKYARERITQNNNKV